MFSRRHQGGEPTAAQLWQEQSTHDHDPASSLSPEQQRFVNFVGACLKRLSEQRNSDARQLHILSPTSIFAGLRHYDTVRFSIPGEETTHWRESPTTAWLLPQVVQRYPEDTYHDLSPLLLTKDAQCSRILHPSSLVVTPDSGYYLPESHLIALEQLPELEQVRTERALRRLS